MLYVGTAKGEFFKFNLATPEDFLQINFGDLLQLGLNEQAQKVVLTHPEGLNLLNAN
ncbi:MAG: hypothetical protein FD167_3727 [bacterium]|nr:MAG: hypothetical protein FD167_3727 [bacterium]